MDTITFIDTVKFVDTQIVIDTIYDTLNVLSSNDEETGIVAKFSAILVPIVAIFGIIIAWQQRKINLSNLNLSKFEKRFKLYEIVGKCVSAVLEERKVELQELVDWDFKSQGIKYLFNNNVNKWVSDLIKEVEQYNSLTILLQNTPHGHEYDSVLKKKIGIRSCIIKRVKDRERIFDKFLKI